VTAGPPPAVASPCTAIGEQKFAIILAEFPGIPFPYQFTTPDQVFDLFQSTDKVSLDSVLREQSSGRAWATSKMAGPFLLDRNYDRSREWPEGIQAALRAAEPYIDFREYNRVVVVWPVSGISGFVGLSRVGCTEWTAPTQGKFTGSVITLHPGGQLPWETLVGLVSHEFGHCLGLAHAFSRDYSPLAVGPPGAAGRRTEYGDLFSVMGRTTSGGALHLAAPHKRRLGWLENGANLAEVETSGSFRLEPLEGQATGLQAPRIRRPGSDQRLWLEYRQPIGQDQAIGGFAPSAFSGALVHLEDAASSPEETDLLDFSPNTGGDFRDAALRTGATWSDRYSLLALRIDAATPRALDVTVTYDTPCTTFSPAGRAHGHDTETGSIGVTAPGDCAWAVASTAPWLIVTSGENGRGNGTVTYVVGPNSGNAARAAAIYIARQRFAITQDRLNYAPTGKGVTPGAGSVAAGRALRFEAQTS
jgi:M6 family metalloprotease-like protein